MKFSINRQAFLKNLADVQRAIPSKTTIPILTGIKLVVSQEGITLTGSDSEVSIEIFLPVEHEELQLSILETGSIVLPARFFGEIVKKLPQNTFTLETNDQLQATITAGSAAFTLNGLSAHDYPQLPEVEKDHVLTLPVPLFRQVILQTSIAVSTAESRPILTGIHMVIANNQLKAVATDSHRLSQRIIPLEMPETSNALTFEITLPGKTLIELSRIIDGLETIDFAITENQVLFQTETLSFYSRLLEGRYPDTDRLINNQFNTAITVVASDLVAAVDRASLMSHTDKNNIATLSITENRILLTGNSPEIGKVEEEITVENYEGASLDVSFNPDYLKDALRLFGSSEATIQFLEANRPFTLTLKDNHSDIPYSFIQLVTPVRTFNG
ncbi:DNA polymerase III subunit beta [uncultured Granulicatella sp.]|uniref:DNA polymerase III subunit beta n=1 Tax=uncultured Granulicatella sp. TaxID=316089 RepID=UPI0028D7B3DB|nr:DNA polymerase III subunit beta [uncultured Granulicatella sp.]